MDSSPGLGTNTRATFQHDHIDRAPLGDMAATLSTMIAGNHEVDFVYRHFIDENEFLLDTREIKNELEDVPITDPSVIQYLDKSIKKALADLEAQELKRRPK